MALKKINKNLKNKSKIKPFNFNVDDANMLIAKICKELRIVGVPRKTNTKIQK
jgi:hypothetical protein